MTKYEDISAAALKHVDKLVELEDHAGADIYRVVKGYTEFIGMPMDRVSYMHADVDFKPSGERVEVWRKARLRRFADDFVGCIVVLRYGDEAKFVDELLKLSVKRKGLDLHVKLGLEGQTFTAPRAEDVALRPLFERISTETLQSLQRGAVERSQIGFVRL